MKTRDELIDDLLTLAFAEDVGDGDHTTLSTIPADETGKQQLIVKEEGILAGVKADSHTLLVAVTEMQTQADMDRFVGIVENFEQP